MNPNSVKKALSIIDALSSLPTDDVAESIILALAIFGVIQRNKTRTLLEHFDDVNSSYRKCFKLIQDIGIETDLERLQSSKGHQEGHRK